MAQVLVVEDDRDTRQVLHLILEDAGYTVAEAADGLEGLAAIQASTVPLVVLLDLDLPKLNGIEVLQAVARDARLVARHAFVLITAVSQSQFQAAEEICATLSVPLVMKPFSMDTLLDQVASAARRLPSIPQAQT
ncbi:MAG TPA: response regulator [Ktedonobacterales bacterium]|nr:response regulator [Ktedonobacterales bacterium]